MKLLTTQKDIDTYCKRYGLELTKKVLLAQNWLKAKEIVMPKTENGDYEVQKTVQFQILNTIYTAQWSSIFGYKPTLSKEEIVKYISPTKWSEQKVETSQS